MGVSSFVIPEVPTRLRPGGLPQDAPGMRREGALEESERHRQIVRPLLELYSLVVARKPSNSYCTANTTNA